MPLQQRTGTGVQAADIPADQKGAGEGAEARQDLVRRNGDSGVCGGQQRQDCGKLQPVPAGGKLLQPPGGAGDEQRHGHLLFHQLRRQGAQDLQGRFEVLRRQAREGGTVQQERGPAGGDFLVDVHHGALPPGHQAEVQGPGVVPRLVGADVPDHGPVILKAPGAGLQLPAVAQEPAGGHGDQPGKHRQRHGPGQRDFLLPDAEAQAVAGEQPDPVKGQQAPVLRLEAAGVGHPLMPQQEGDVLFIIGLLHAPLREFHGLPAVLRPEGAARLQGEAHRQPDQGQPLGVVQRHPQRTGLPGEDAAPLRLEGGVHAVQHMAGPEAGRGGHGGGRQREDGGGQPPAQAEAHSAGCQGQDGEAPREQAGLGEVHCSGLRRSGHGQGPPRPPGRAPGPVRSPPRRPPPGRRAPPDGTAVPGGAGRSGPDTSHRPG